jgi:hypothetical protein
VDGISCCAIEGDSGSNSILDDDDDFNSHTDDILTDDDDSVLDDDDFMTDDFGLDIEDDFTLDGISSFTCNFTSD